MDTTPSLNVPILSLTWEDDLMQARATQRAGLRSRAKPAVGRMLRLSG